MKKLKINLLFTLLILFVSCLSSTQNYKVELKDGTIIETSFTRSYKISTAEVKRIDYIGEQ